MSDHARAQIRAAVAQALGGLPTTGARVFAARSSPSSDDNLPALLVYTRGERSGFDGMGSDTARPLERELRIWVVGVVLMAATEPDDTLDRICAEVEAALMASAPVAALLQKLELVSTDFDVPPDQGARRLGRVGMTWRGTYRTAAGTPTAFV